MSNNCSQSSTIKTTVVNAMKSCSSPVYNVIHTIAEHSQELFRIVKNLQNTTNESGSNGFVIRDPVSINYDTCLCNDASY